VLEAGDAAVGLAEAQHAAGNTGDLDLANERALYEQLRTDVKRSEADVVVAHEALTRLLGLWGVDAAFHVPSRLPDPPPAEAPLDHLEAFAIGRRLDLASARARTQALSHAAAMAKNFRFVGSAGAGVGFERSPERYSAIAPGASLELPIFDQKQAAIARLEALVRQAQARESALAVDIRSEVRAARGRLVATRDVVDRYAKVVVPLREQVVRLSQEQYNAMLLGAYQLLAAKQSEVNAYRAFIEALRDYWIESADLEVALGAALPSGISPNPIGAPAPISPEIQAARSRRCKTR
jgi:cobalt-zinc-cadmium efflux system outer membrane protein